MNFTSNTTGTEALDFVHLRIPAVNAADELRSFRTLATRVVNPTNGSNYIARVHIFGEVTAAGASGTRSEQNYIYKTDF